MTPPEDDKAAWPLVVVAAILGTPLFVMNFKNYGARWGAEIDRHPDTWPIRFALFAVLGVGGFRAIDWLRHRDKETDPLWKRLLHLFAIFALGALLLAALLIFNGSAE